MAKANKMLVKAPVKISYLKNHVNERATYLELPKEQYRYSVEEDIKKGGLHLKEIAELMHKKNLSRVFAISTDNEEMGFMAVTYLAMHMIERRAAVGDLPFYSDYEYDNHKWYESEIKIPIIKISEIQSYLRKDELPFQEGGFLTTQAQRKNPHQPYWTSCTRESVCVVVKRESVSTDCLEMFKLFEKNRNVFVLFLEDGENETDMFDELPFGVMDRKGFQALRNNFILSYTADAAEVSFGEWDEMQYYKNVLKHNILQRGMRVKKGFSYEKVVNLAKSIQKKSVCEMIEKVVNYALKDVEEGQGTALGNKDFQFADHFMGIRTGAKLHTSSREQMEDNLVGMYEIKQQVYDVVNVMKYNQLRMKRNIGRSQYHNVHVMLGAPGTAKTTVARYMGEMMFDAKLLPDNRFICVNGAELKGMYVGHSAPRTKSLFENYDVIIIDEAYSLVETNGKMDSFGNEAIAQLIIELEKHATDKLVIFAGYGGKYVDKKDNKMQVFLDSNPGIRSRITSTFYFDSYSAEEMAEIFMRMAKLGNYKVETEVKENVKRFFADRVEARDFGNGREARALLENTVLFAAKRVMTVKKDEYTEEELMMLTLSDVNAAIEKLMRGFGVSKEVTRKIGFSM